MNDDITINGQPLFPSEYVAAVDLKGKEATLTIDHAEKVELYTPGHGKNFKGLLFFVGAKKKMVLNKTNARTIARLYGGELNGWKGKKIILYPTTCTCGGETVSCLRVRDYTPSAPPAAPVDGQELIGGSQDLNP